MAIYLRTLADVQSLFEAFPALQHADDTTSPLYQSPNARRSVPPMGGKRNSGPSVARTGAIASLFRKYSFSLTRADRFFSVIWKSYHARCFAHARVLRGKICCFCAVDAASCQSWKPTDIVRDRTACVASGGAGWVFLNAGKSRQGAARFFSCPRAFQRNEKGGFRGGLENWKVA